MKKNLQRYLPKLMQHKLLAFKIEPEIQLTTYNIFALRIMPKIEQLQTGILEDYFNSRIMHPPYRTTSFLSFMTLLFIQDFKILKDFMQLMEFELNVNIYFECFFNLKN